MIPEVHLPESSGSKRSLVTGRAFRLNEPDMPHLTTNVMAPTTRVADLVSLVRYLNVEKSARYQPTATQTYCNIYACDLTHLAGYYLPRVWWMPEALADLAQGKAVPVAYAKTVSELNANSLYDWLVTYGPQFGWSRVASLDLLQGAANQGRVGVICAAHSVAGHSGHIAVVVPEKEQPAIRSADKVVIPLQSQAGAHNHCFSCAEGQWWKAPIYRGFGFWVQA